MSPKKSTTKTNPQGAPRPATDHRAMILTSLQTLRIKLEAQELDDLVREATQTGMSPWELLHRFLSAPASQSIQRSIERRIKNAGLPTSATLEAFDWAFNAQTINKASMLELASGEFVQRGDNLAFVGQSGLGKPQPSQYPFSYRGMRG